MHRFFTDNIQNGIAKLDAEESKHLFKVLRMSDGDQVEVFDGKDKLYLGRILKANPKETEVELVETLKAKKDEFKVTMAVAPTKNLSRWEVFLEKATEIGIDAVIPISCDHSERKVLKRERQLRILKSAVKQSQKLSIPELEDLTGFDDLINRPFDGEKYIAHCHGSLPKMNLSSIHPKGKKALILIGPEGDFSTDEVKSASQKGFVPVNISKSRLRTETAALVALHTIHLINE